MLYFRQPDSPEVVSLLWVAGQVCGDPDTVLQHIAANREQGK